MSEIMPLTISAVKTPTRNNDLLFGPPIKDANHPYTGVTEEEWKSVWEPIGRW